MRCEDIQGDLSAYLDGALPMEQRAAIKDHLVSCPKCTMEMDDYQRIGRVLREEVAERAPAGLQERIRTEIAREADEESGAARWGRRSVAQAAALLLVAGLSAAGGWFTASNVPRMPALAHDVTAAHARSLLQENLTQIASSDRHTVKPWFAGRLDFSPVVLDLGAQGFPLVGGRLDYVGDRRVAAIIYMRRQHVISLFAWPSDQSLLQPSASTSAKGYNSIRWTRDGMVYWAISDLNMKELGEFQALLGAT